MAFEETAIGAAVSLIIAFAALELSDRRAGSARFGRHVEALAVITAVTAAALVVLICFEALASGRPLAPRQRHTAFNYMALALIGFVGGIATSRLRRVSEGQQNWQFLRLTRHLQLGSGLYAVLVLALFMSAPLTQDGSSGGLPGSSNAPAVAVGVLILVWAMASLADRWMMSSRRRAFILRVRRHKLRTVRLVGIGIEVDAWVSGSGEPGRVWLATSAVAKLASAHDRRRITESGFLAERLNWHGFCGVVYLVDESARPFSSDRRVWKSKGAVDGLVEFPESVWRSSLGLQIAFSSAPEVPVPSLGKED